MRLVDLDPKWWAAQGRIGQGMVFLCPHCRQGYLCVAFANPLDGGQPWNIGTEEHRPISALWDILYDGGVIPVGTWIVPPGYSWQRVGETFDSLSLSPSVDASKAGCWHGFLTNGEIT